VIGGLLWWAGSFGGSDPDVIATRGIHWHPELTIYVDGEKEDIPANIGLAGGHQPIHTHVEDVAQGVLHFEFGDIVRTNDTHLGIFFEIWNKDMQTAFGSLEKMTVNGEENTEYENYAVQEEDKIELFYVSVEEEEAE
jgi:hypothetical protein